MDRHGHVNATKDRLLLLLVRGCFEIMVPSSDSRWTVEKIYVGRSVVRSDTASFPFNALTLELADMVSGKCSEEASFCNDQGGTATQK
jgi:hypothetical protein